jgi:transposase
MEQKRIVGIDVSKCTLDICIKPGCIVFRISNDLQGFKQLKKCLGTKQSVLVVMEHTGHYSFRLEKFLMRHAIEFCKIPALEIKRSIGVVRGKTDAVDATRIAEYAWLRRDHLTATQMLGCNLIKLRSLLSLRSKLVRDRSGYMGRLKEMIATGTCRASDSLGATQKEVIKMLSVQIRKMETSIQELIKADSSLLKTYQLLRSIKGVGMIIAASMIASTEDFKRFSNARKFNCYAGLAPFKYESGTSVRNKSRVSHLANKELKTLLNLSAFCAIRCDQEMKQYFQKRVAEGKSKLSCLNIIRSKIVSRMFAVIKRQTPYQPFHIAA